MSAGFQRTGLGCSGSCESNAIVAFVLGGVRRLGEHRGERKMSFVSLAWLTKAVAAKPRPLPPHGPTQRCRSCLDHAFDAHAPEQYELRSHPAWHSKHSGRGKCDEWARS